MPRLSRPGRARTWVSVGVATAVLLGIAARFVTRTPLWLDEALSVNIAVLPLGEIGDALRHDGHPPFYYWVLHGWSSIFGEDDLAVRSLSALFSLLTLPLMWRLGRRTGGPAVARWALVLLALSPFAVRYATEARMYSLVMLLVVSGALLVDSVLRRPRIANAGALALVVAALLWTHYWSLYLLATVGALLVLRWWRDPAERHTTRWAVAAFGAGGLLFLPWVPSLLDQAAHTGTPWARPSRPTVVAQVTIADLGGGGFAEAILLGTLLVVLMVAAYAHQERGALRQTADPLDVRVLTAVALGTLLLGSAASFVTGSGYVSRYGSVVAPLLLVVVAVGILRLRPIWLQRGVATAVVILAVVAIGHNVADPRTSAGKVADRIDATADGTDDGLVVVCPDQLGPALERALRHRDLVQPVLAYPTGDDGRFVDWRDYEDRNDDADPEDFVDDVLDRADGAPIWLVWSGTYRTFKGDCERVVNALGLERTATLITDPVIGAFESSSLIRFG